MEMTHVTRRFSHGKRHPRETILVQWTIDQRLWRDFVSVSLLPTRNPSAKFTTATPPEPFPASGIEVVIRDDATFVGQECISSYVPGGGYHGISVHGSRLEIDVSHEYGDVVYMLPIPAQALAPAWRWMRPACSSLRTDSTTPSAKPHRFTTCPPSAAR